MRKVAVFIIMLLLIAGCTQTKSTPTETKSKPTEKVEIPSSEFNANFEILRGESHELGKFDPKTGDFTPVYKSAKNLIKPTAFLEDYIKKHPKVAGGAETLVLIAIAWQQIDILVGGQKREVAEAYYLLIDLYPNHKEVSEAKRWLRLNGYQVKD